MWRGFLSGEGGTDEITINVYLSRSYTADFVLVASLHKQAIEGRSSFLEKCYGNTPKCYGKVPFLLPALFGYDLVGESSRHADGLSCRWGTLDVSHCSFEIYLNLLKFECSSM